MPSDISFGWDWNPDQQRDIEWAMHQMRRFRYKNGWVFEVCRHSTGPALSVKIMVEDSRHPGRGPSYRESNTAAGHPFQIERDDLIEVSAAVDIPKRLLIARDSEDFFRWIRRVVEFVEQHEIDEWFRVDGKLVNDPHALPGYRAFR